MTHATVQRTWLKGIVIYVSTCVTANSDLENNNHYHNNNSSRALGKGSSPSGSLDRATRRKSKSLFTGVPMLACLFWCHVPVWKGTPLRLRVPSAGQWQRQWLYQLVALILLPRSATKQWIFDPWIMEIA